MVQFLNELGYNQVINRGAKDDDTTGVIKMGTAEIIIGSGVIILNLVSFLMKRYKYLFLPAVVSILMMWLLLLFREDTEFFHFAFPSVFFPGVQSRGHSSPD